MFRKGLKFMILTMLAYLLQATVAQYIAVWSIAPNIALAMIAVISIAYGRKYTFAMALWVGYLLEIMLPELDYINLILYPVCAMLGALAFSDKSERKLEEERTMGNRHGNLPAHLRTLLCALLSILVFEAVNLLYTYLSGIVIDGDQLRRSAISILYTTVLAALLQFPIRWWLGVYKLKKAR